MARTRSDGTPLGESARVARTTRRERRRVFGRSRRAPHAQAADESPVASTLLRPATTDDLAEHERELMRLAGYERAAEDDHRLAAALDVWQPTFYERDYLPGLRLAGLPSDQRPLATLQNCADLHAHTEWSDGDRLENVLAAALEQKLDVLAITDHDEIDGALEARRIVHERRLPLAIVPGTEVSTRDGHIGALFVTQRIPKNLSAEETVRRIHAAGGLAVAHHPFAPRLVEWLLGARLGCRELVHSVPFDAIEGTNAVPGYGRRYNLEAHAALERRNVRIGLTASSDAHGARFVGKGRTFFAGNQGVFSLRLALQHGFVSGAEGYWSTKDKLAYRIGLGKAIVRNLLGRNRARH